MEKINYYTGSFIYGVNTMNKKKLVLARIGELNRLHKINVYNVENKILIGSFNKKQLLRHIILSECYIRNNKRFTKEVFELELYTRRNSKTWLEKHSLELDFEKQYFNSLSTEEQKQYKKKRC